MLKRIPRSFEYFLISNDFLAIWLLPVLALLCGGGAIYGSGISGNPDISENVIPSSYMEKVPKALKDADGAAYEGWGGAPRAMSSFLVGQIKQNLSLADSDDAFEGKSFESALSFTAMGEAAAAEPPPAGSPSARPTGQASANSAATRLQNSQDALSRWSKRSWCTLRDWDPNWSKNIVRPLVARGVGGCSAAERFAARSPIAAAVGLVPGILILLLLCTLAAVCGYAAFIQSRVREAYQLTYKSRVMGE